MKKLLFTLAILAFGCSAYAVDITEKKDSTKIYLNSSETAYIEAGDLVLGLNMGLNMPDGIDAFNSHSYHVSWELARVGIELGSKQDIATVGVGMTWNKYATTNSKGYFKYDGQIKVGQEISSHNIDYSRYLTYSFSLPVQYTHIFNNGVFLTAGPVVNFNIHSSIFREQEEGYTKISTKVKNAYHNPVTVDLCAGFGYKDVGLMVKYSPMNVIKKDKGPDFQKLAIGIIIK